MNWIPIKTGLFRLVRVAASLGLAAGVAYVANDPRYVILAPVISGVAKYIREAFKLDNIPI